MDLLSRNLIHRKTPLVCKNKVLLNRRWLIASQPVILAIFGIILVNCMYTEARSTPLDQENLDSVPLIPNFMPTYYNKYADNNNKNLAAALEDSSTQKQKTKRRLVVRVPFAQNPDTTHLSRIYRQLFTQQKQKKLIQPGFGYSIRHLID